MQRSFDLQTSDLETVQELTNEEAEKIVGGLSNDDFDDPPCYGCYNLRLKWLQKRLKSLISSDLK